MPVIEFALKKAAYINSKSSKLAEEVKKFTNARKIVKSDFVLRCPFCWMPVKEKDSECPHCLANFYIDRAFFNNVGKAKADVLDKAINRYNNVLQNNTTNSHSVYLLFYLAMAYLNRQYYQEGLAQLDEITNTLPENRVFVQQKALLTKYMQVAGLISTSAQQTKQNRVTSRILVVEDSAVTRKVIARTLIANGYEVLEAKDANEALMDIEKQNLDLVLLDIILPGRDGYEILAEIRKMPRFAKIPVVMLTSRDSLFDKLKGKVSDANEYLTKPFQPDELLSVVKKYLK
jgi:twitching motility two-component system response regulator PilG